MSNDSYIGVIPARYASSRFPAKALCDLDGKPMIKRVFDSAMKWDKWKCVYVATDHAKIFEACKRLNIPVLMTSSAHTDCLDRVAEVARILKDYETKYIIIQGDEPLFDVRTLDVDLSPTIVNFYTEVREQDELYGDVAANAVKVVVSKNQKALYFSRYTLPYHNVKTKRSTEEPKFFKQLGIYVFTGQMLQLYTQLSESHLECMEGVGLNRLLENDIEVNMRYTAYDSVSIDTEEDRQRLLKRLDMLG